ncbi:MAG TPA: acyl carrier protein [Solirubrobacterales bacterium]|jgi:acyl carrier protein|nr:acyl carrier protein [Solirubrobacterales bacterium]
MSDRDVATPVEAADVRARILDVCGPALAVCGVDVAAPPADLDLRASGAIDSLGFIELVTELEEAFGVELELEDMDPEQLTMLEPLARAVAEQASGARR